MPRIVPFLESGHHIEALHAPMLDAFSNYVVPLQPSKAALMETLLSRSFDPDASFVALEDSEIVAFWAVGARHQNRYLIMSGTRTEHQGKGLASGLGRAALQAAKDAGGGSFFLEVIAGNDNAQRLYVNLGFKAVRTLNCYRLDHPNPDGANGKITDFETASSVFKDYATWAPTWQNANETLSALELTCFLHPEGAAIISNGGMVHQIAAGSPTALAELLSAAATLSSLTLINVDTSDMELNRLLEDLGAIKFAEQLEMCASI